MNKYYSLEERKHYLNQWETSGKDIKHFCLENDIKESTFHSWKKRFCHREPDLTVPDSEFVEISVNKSTIFKSSPILLQTGKYSISIPVNFDTSTLKRLLMVLEAIHD